MSVDDVGQRRRFHGRKDEDPWSNYRNHALPWVCGGRLFFFSPILFAQVPSERARSLALSNEATVRGVPVSSFAKAVLDKVFINEETGQSPSRKWHTMSLIQRQDNDSDRFACILLSSWLNSIDSLLSVQVRIDRLLFHSWINRKVKRSS